MWFWRNVLNMTLSDKDCNEEVLRCDAEERAIISVINRRQRVWLGHSPTAWRSCPIGNGGKNNRKETTWKTSSGNGFFRNGMEVKRFALDRELQGRTCLWVEYTHTDRVQFYR